MKVLHIINNLNRGGAETLLLRICVGVHEKDPSITFSVIILDENYDLLEKFEKAHIPVELVPIDTFPNWQRPFKLAQAIKKQNPDIVHTHLLKADRVGQVAAWLAGVKTRYCTIHNMEPKRNRHDKITRMIASIFAQKLIAVSESAKKFCIDEKMYPPKKVQVIYNAPGFDIVEQKVKTRIHNPLRIITIGRLHAQKGHIYLIRAISKLQKLDIPCILRIIGEGDERDVLEKEINKLSLSQSVFLVGLSDTIQEELTWADIFVAPSLYEGLPLAQIEAMMMGVPMVVSDIPPHRELLYAYDNSLFFASKSTQACVNSLQNIQKKEIEKLSSMVLKNVERFSYQVMINNYFDLYKRMK